jgi:hypothetical protein
VDKDDLFLKEVTKVEAKAVKVVVASKGWAPPKVYSSKMVSKWVKQ